ncbi:MAG: hypothetical protein KGM16_15665 [Bacteroidota bacterium]|nr:hypothetical protein [Bacteroidota bacterium]
MKQKVTIEMIDFLLILLFVYAATSKLWEYNTFIIQLGNSPFLKPFAGIIVWLIPTIELGIALMLTLKRTRFYGLLFALLLLIIFTGYIAGMLLSGSPLPCSCGGVISELSWKEHLVFNLVFVATSMAGLVLDKKQKANYH